MGITIEREKPRNLLASVLYRSLKLPLPDRTKFRLFLNLEWIFARLAHEMSFRIYSVDNHPWTRQKTEFIVNFLQPEQRVLDLGCAGGDITYAIAKKVKLAVGIDHSQRSVDSALEKYGNENPSFVCVDAIDYLKTTDKQFDVLILSHVLEHIDAPEAFLKRFRESFRFIYIEVPDFDATILNQFRKDLHLPLVHTDNDHVSEFDRHDMKDLFQQCGLHVIRSEFIFGVQRYWCEVI